VDLDETTLDDLVSTSKIRVYYPNGTLLNEFDATKTFSRDITPSDEYKGWIDINNLQIAVEASVGIALNSNLTSDIDLTNSLSSLLFLGDTDSVSVELDTTNSPTDYPDAKFRMDIGMALDLTDSQGTELRLEIVKEYKVAGEIKNYLLVGLYYINKDGSLYLSVPAMDINGIKVSHVDLSELLSTMTPLKWKEALAQSGEEDKTFGLLAQVLNLDMSVVADYIDKLVEAAHAYTDEQGNVIKASLALAMGNNQIGVAINFALIRLIMQYATDMGWLNLDKVLGIADMVDDMLGLDRIELVLDRGDGDLGADGDILGQLKAMVGIYFDKNDGSSLGSNLMTQDFDWLGVEITIGDLSVDLGDSKTARKLATHDFISGLKTKLEFPKYEGAHYMYRGHDFVNLASFGDLTSYPDLLDLSAFHIGLSGDIELDLFADQTGTHNSFIDTLVSLVTGLDVDILALEEGSVAVHRNVSDNWRYGFLVEADVDFANWNNTELKIEFTYSRKGDTGTLDNPVVNKMLIIGLYYWGKTNSFYLDLSNFGLMKVKVEGLNFVAILNSLAGIDVTQGSLEIGKEILASLLGSSDVTQVIQSLLDQYEENKLFGSAEEEEQQEQEEEEVTRLACGCTNPLCLAAGSCYDEQGNLFEGEHHCACVVENAMAKLTIGTYIRNAAQGVRGADFHLTINTEMVQKLLYMFGVDLEMPTDSQIDLDIKLGNGFDKVTLAITSYDLYNDSGERVTIGGKEQANVLSFCLDTLNIGYAVGEEPLLKDKVYTVSGNNRTEISNFSGLNLGGMVGIANNWSGNIVVGLIETVIASLYPDNLTLYVGTNSSYLAADGATMESGARATSLGITRIGPNTALANPDAASTYTHGLNLDISELIANVPIIGRIVRGLYFYQDTIMIDLSIAINLPLIGEVELYKNVLKAFTLDFNSILGGFKVKAGTDDKTDISEDQDEDEITADDLAEGLKHPIVGMSFELGSGDIDLDGNYIQGDGSKSAIRIQLNPKLVGGIAAVIPEKLVGFIESLNVDALSELKIDSPDNASLLYAIYDGFISAIMNKYLSTWPSGITTTARNLVDNWVGDAFVSFLAQLLPFPEVTANSDCALTIVMDDTTVAGKANVISKIYLRIYTPSTGEYWYLMIHNQGINMSGVNTSASNCVEWDDDVNLGVRVVADVFDLDHDKDGVVDYMEELPDYAVVNQWVNVPSGAENMPYSVMASWSDAVFQIDPTKFVGYIDEDGYTYKRDAQGNNI
ncbi:MAG: hypothetical protein J5755_04335, partial [Clostridia bacterium]|nr:hypothetical protein [Clostridia bacterium]